ncbi:hypothetical protein [Paludisphaera rhizosphaerae]|uniref:hypothetical protein n=1 Tax=Paludisphaera rhizosphaerae TaxID=2711216 RepID=UPI0013EB4898|nr:hypothetical protein [Paludisphaera rhizosphaerae]
MPTRDPSGRKAADPAGVLENSQTTKGQQPSVKPSTSSATKGLIPVSGAPAVRPSSAGDPYAFWTEYYAKHDETPDQLHETVRLLNQSGKTRDVHAAILGYLKKRPKSAEFWMYEALALAIEMNGGKPEDIKTALDYAADLAQRSHNPNHLVSAADKLLLKGYTDRVGALLDEAAEKIPHRAEPIAMSINLALKTRDPKRMAESVDQLLSLGWPGQDDYLRAEARKQVEALAKTLTEEGRTDEAEKLRAALPAAEARDVYVRLSWDGEADFDLVVEEPLGAPVSYDMPRSVFGGALIKNGKGSRPEEVYVCPRGFNGNYTIRIMPIAVDPAKPTTRLTLETITHEGDAKESKKTVVLAPNDPNAKPVVVSLTDGRRTKALPFVSATAVREAFEETIKERAAKEKARKDAAPKRPAATPRNAIPIQ